MDDRSGTTPARPAIEKCLRKLGADQILQSPKSNDVSPPTTHFENVLNEL
jgi:hypothetical protein